MYTTHDAHNRYVLQQAGPQAAAAAGQRRKGLVISMAGGRAQVHVTHLMGLYGEWDDGDVRRAAFDFFNIQECALIIWCIRTHTHVSHHHL